jgi:hypothetical protein
VASDIASSVSFARYSSSGLLELRESAIVGEVPPFVGEVAHTEVLGLEVVDDLSAKSESSSPAPECARPHVAYPAHPSDTNRSRKTTWTWIVFSGSFTVIGRRRLLPPDHQLVVGLRDAGEREQVFLPDREARRSLASSRSPRLYPTEGCPGFRSESSSACSAWAVVAPPEHRVLPVEAIGIQDPTRTRWKVLEHGRIGERPFQALARGRVAGLSWDTSERVEDGEGFRHVPASAAP